MEVLVIALLGNFDTQTDRETIQQTDMRVDREVTPLITKIK